METGEEDTSSGETGASDSDTSFYDDTSDSGDAETGEGDTGGTETADIEETGDSESPHIPSADAVVIGTVVDELVGSFVSSAGDVDGDGIGDLWVSSTEILPNTAWLYLGPLGGTSTVDEADARAFSSTGKLGASSSDDTVVVSAQDVDADGYADSLFGAAGSGRTEEWEGVAILLSGPIAVEAHLEDGDATVWGEAEEDFLGRAIAGLGDTDGDGLDDIAVGAWGVDVPGAYSEDGGCPPYDEDYGWGEEPDDGQRAGATYLYLGPVSGTLSASDADATLTGELRDDLSGQDLAPAGDLDGDGLADLLVGARGQCEGNGGAAYVVLGPLSGVQSLADADGKLLSMEIDEDAGATLAGNSDMDGDGLPDILVGAPSASGGGAVYLVYGPSLGEESLEDADAVVRGESRYIYTGDAIALPGDLNGDGNGDLLIDVPTYDAFSENDGAAFLFSGPVSGAYAARDADLILAGAASGDILSWSLAGLGDTNGDGLPDILLGAPGSDLGAEDGGAAYLLLGGGAILGGL